MEISKIKETITQILSNQPINLQELIEFINEYCKIKGKSTPTAEQMQLIVFGINSRVFDIHHVAKEFAKELGLQVTTIADSEGRILKIIVT